VLEDALIVDRHERARPLGHRFGRVINETVSERAALAAQRDAFHHGRQRRLIQVIDQIPAEHDVGGLGATRRQQRVRALANAARIDFSVQGIESFGELDDLDAAAKPAEHAKRGAVHRTEIEDDPAPARMQALNQRVKERRAQALWRAVSHSRRRRTFAQPPRIDCHGSLISSRLPFLQLPVARASTAAA
jgi:hypothetical protein